MSILSDVGAWLLGIGSDVLNFFKAAITALANNPQLVSAAMTAVTNAENLAIASVDKKAAAYSEIVGNLTSAGLPVVASQINLAIETAVQKLQAQQSASSAAAGTASTTVAASTASVSSGAASTATAS